MHRINYVISLLSGLCFLLSNAAYTAKPLWTFSAPNPSIVTVGLNELATAEYTVTNQSMLSACFRESITG